jgi:hypothetical protein
MVYQLICYRILLPSHYIDFFATESIFSATSVCACLYVFMVYICSEPALTEFGWPTIVHTSDLYLRKKIVEQDQAPFL